MSEIENVIYESLRRGGVSDPDRITRLVTNGLRREFCGTSIYIDRGYRSRNESIISQALSGIDIQAIAEKHAITQHRVKRIVNGWK